MVDGNITQQQLDSEPPVFTQTYEYQVFYKHATLEEFLRFSKSFCLCMSTFECDMK